jgi:hypothetical protein
MILLFSAYRVTQLRLFSHWTGLSFTHLKTCYNQEAITWMINHKGRNITRYQVEELIGKSPSALNGFKVNCLFFLNPNVILDHFFSIAYNSVTSASNKSRDPEPSASSATD